MSDSRGPAGSGGTPFARDGSSDINHKNGISAQGGRIADSNTPIRFGQKMGLDCRTHLQNLCVSADPELELDLGFAESNLECGDELAAGTHR